MHVDKHFLFCGLRLLPKLGPNASSQKIWEKLIKLWRIFFNPSMSNDRHTTATVLLAITSASAFR